MNNPPFMTFITCVAKLFFECIDKCKAIYFPISRVITKIFYAKVLLIGHLYLQQKDTSLLFDPRMGS
jgi:hypothetical protein